MELQLHLQQTKFAQKLIYYIPPPYPLTMYEFIKELRF